MAVAGQIVIELVATDTGMKMAVKDAGASLRQFETVATQTARSVKRLEEAQFSLGTKFRHMVMTLGNLRFALMDINDAFVRLPANIMKNAGELERMQALMKGLSKEITEVGKAADAQRGFNFVTDLAKKAPFEINAISDAFVKLKTAGIDPTKGALAAMADSVARFGGSGEQLKRATIAIQQMAGKGVISMEELRQQLGEAVPTAMQAMADGMGMSMAELTKAVSKGTLAAEVPLMKMLARLRVENEGASEEMMKTWVGKLSQLKTEWALASKAIADAGFGDAAKEAVDSLKDALASREFRDFAKEFGKDLGEVIRSFSTAVKFVIEYKDAIMGLVTAYVAYKGVHSFALPMMDAVNKAYARQRDAITTLKNANLGKGSEERALAAEQISNANAVSSAQMQATARSIASMRSEMEFRRAMSTQARAEAATLAASIANGQRARGANGRFVSSESVRAQIREINNVEAAHTAAANRIAQGMTVVQTAHAQAAIKTLQHGNAVDALASGTRRLGVAATAAAAAQRVAGGVWSLLGGWAGLAVIAISLVASAWYKLADAAREAKAAQSREDKKESTEDDLKARQAELTAAERKRNALAAQVEYGKRQGKTGPAAVKMLNDQIAQLASANADVDRLRTSVSNRAGVVAESAIEDRVTAHTRGAEQEVRALKDGAATVMAQERKTSEERLKGLKQGSKEYQKVRNENTAREEAAYQANKNKQAAALEARAASLEGLAKGGRGQTEGERTAMMRAAAKLREEAAATREIIQSNVDAVAALPQINSKTSGGGSGDAKESPLQKALEKLKVSREGYEQELEDLNSVLGKTDVVATQVAKYTAMIENGKFGALNAGEKKTLLDAVRATFGEKKNLDEAQEVADATEKLTGKAKDISDRFAEAMAVIQDPLGTNRKGSEERALDKLINSLGEHFPAAAAKAGTSLQQLRERALTVDGTATIEDLARETNSLEESLTSTVRAEVAKRRLIEDEAHRDKMQKLIDRMTAEGVAASTIAAAQAVLDKNTAARAAATAEASKTPLQKLLTEWTNTTDAMEKASAGWATQTSDYLTDMVMGGKASFSDLANSIIKDLIRIQIQKAIVGVINAVTGNFFADGGVMSSSGSLPLKAYANGGIANSPQMAIFGEGRMNEAYVPLPDGRTIPVTLMGGQGGASIQVNVYKDGQSDVSGTADDSTMRMVDRIRGVVRDEMLTQKRPGGLLAN